MSTGCSGVPVGVVTVVTEDSVVIDMGSVVHQSTRFPLVVVVWLMRPRRPTSTLCMVVRVVRARITVRGVIGVIGVVKRAIEPEIARTPRSSPGVKVKGTKEKVKVESSPLVKVKVRVSVN